MAEDLNEPDSTADRPATPEERLADVVPISRGRKPNVAPGDRPKVRHAIGDVLRSERTEQDRTLHEVATDAAVSLPYLSEIERGRKEVSSDLLESVCDALGVEVADVLRRAADRLEIGMDRGPQLRLAA